MNFASPTQTSSAPPPPLALQAIGFFILFLDPTWSFPPFVEWSLEYSSSKDNGVTDPYTAWTFYQTTEDQAINFTKINPLRYYKFRYQIRTKQQTSDYSSPAFAGKPKFLISGGTGSPFITHLNATSSGFGIGEYS